MRFFISGFDPFDKVKINPSQLAVEQLADVVEIDGSSHSVSRLVLPTCCDGATDKLNDLLRAALVQPDDFVVIMSGLADKRSKISLERFAVNVREYRVPDNQGHQRQDEFIVEKAPDALRTRIPLQQLRDHLITQGFPTEISNHAGSFVCNETYYRIMHAWHEDARCKGIIFVHLPDPQRYKKQLEKPDAEVSAEPLPNQEEPEPEIIKQFSDALVEIARFVANCAREQKQI